MATDHFDQRAATWDDDPDKAAQAADVARAVTAAVTPERGFRLLEYGAGTGLVTQALVTLTEPGDVTLADNSAGMRAVLTDKVDAGALPTDARVWDLDLTDPERPAVPGERFDLVVVSMVLHHVHDLDVVLEALAGLVEEDGHLCVADLDTEDGSFHAHLHDFDGHAGFDRSQLAAALQRVGLEVVGVEDCTRIDKDGTTFPVFLATARRPRH